VIFGSTTVSVLRGDTGTEDGFGDIQDVDTVAFAHVPAWTEQGQITRRNPANGALITLTGVWVNLRPSFRGAIVETDRLKNERTDEVLQVETIRTLTGFGGSRRRIFCTVAA
jgi:hypothetical protein